MCAINVAAFKFYFVQFTKKNVALPKAINKNVHILLPSDVKPF